MSFAVQFLRAARLTLVLWLITVVIITLPMLGLARLLAGASAEGSLVFRQGVVVGSRLIGQPFSSGRYLNSRPMGEASLAAANPRLQQRVAAAAEAWRQLGISKPAADLLLASASGADPHISLEAAREQLPRLVQERGVTLSQLEVLLRQNQESPITLRTILPVVNVLGFNLALDRLTAASSEGPKG